METTNYLLGTGDEELERLEYQHQVWRPVTEAFLDRLAIGPGARILDLGCGPGFCLEDLLDRVGPTGKVTGVDSSPRWRSLLEERLGNRPELTLLESSVEDLEVPAGSFDLIFCRWIFCFLPEPERTCARLAEALVPGGILAVQDYNHEGISLFPPSEGFHAVIRATREWFAEGGGDTWIAPKLPPFLRAAGLEPLPVHSTVISGGPDSEAFRWADLFFRYFAEGYLEQGRITAGEHAGFQRDWSARKQDPDCVFCSPILMDVAGRRPS